MSIRVWLLALTVGAAGCAGTASTHAPAGKAADAGAWVTYRCRAKGAATARYRPPDAATVRYDGRVYEMKVAASGSGARYVGGGLEWWTRGTGPGSEGMVLRHNADGSPGDTIDRCAHVSG
jgi:membrane-bound inhibitor of C-type lysozyme